MKSIDYRNETRSEVERAGREVERIEREHSDADQEMTDISEECTIHADDSSSQDLQSSDHDEDMNHADETNDEESEEEESVDDKEAQGEDDVEGEKEDDEDSEKGDENEEEAERIHDEEREEEDGKESKESNESEAAKDTDDDKGAKKTNGNEEGEKAKDAEDSEKGAANNVYDDEEEQYWAPLEEMVADGLITDPRPVTSTEKPGIGAHKERAKLAERFWTKWESRPSNTLADEQEDELLLTHATRHGLTPKAILAKGLLKSGNRNNAGEIAYRVKKLKGKRVDLTPRTREQAWKEYKAHTTPRTARQQETDNLKAAIRRGETIEQIVASGIVSRSKNTRRAIRKRWDDWLRLGEDLPELPS
ncbi:MAG: hypothetical protein Q9207_005388 [Kuettlingeria erythrocarpa]